jgi:hypothetical protein
MVGLSVARERVVERTRLDDRKNRARLEAGEGRRLLQMCSDIGDGHVLDAGVPIPTPSIVVE